MSNFSNLLNQSVFNREDVLTRIIDLIPGIVYLRDKTGRFLLANQNAEKFYGYSVNSLLNMSGEELIALSKEVGLNWEEDRRVIESGKPSHIEESVNAHGQMLFFSTVKTPYASRSDCPVDSVLSVSMDITELKLAAQQIRNQANYDPLTGLANRNLLRRRIKQAILHSKRVHSVGAVMFLDLDNFREINEVYGHITGDLLLKQVAEAFSSQIDQKYILARLSGDEFALLIHEVSEQEEVLEVARRLIKDFEAPFIIEEHRVNMNLSIGISFFPQDADSYEILLKNADLALSTAKRDGGGCFRVFTPQMNVSMQRRREIASQLRSAIDNDEFTLYYQPLVCSRTGKVVGMEALMRWHQCQMPFINPAEFIPIAEQTGLIIPMGEWALRRALEEQGQWLRQNPGICLAVNISTVQFQQVNLINQIKDVLGSFTIDPASIELEITESTLMEDVDEAIRLMNGFHQMGLRLAIDDFGTGYSSLNYLKRFPINKIKIDRAFVKDVETDNDSATITKAIANLGHSLGLKVVAEGVESRGHVEFLKQANVDILQGYYFGRPLPAAQFHEWVKKYS